jgi:hypothetical protein
MRKPSFLIDPVRFIVSGCGAIVRVVRDSTPPQSGYFIRQDARTDSERNGTAWQASIDVNF